MIVRPSGLCLIARHEADEEEPVMTRSAPTRTQHTANNTKGKKMKARMSALALLLATAGCVADQPEELMGARGERLDREAEARARANQGAAVQQVTDAQNGSSVTLPVGGQLTVALAGNRTTGYSWAVAAKPTNLTATGKDYVQDAAPAGMVGVGGTEKFTFRATSAGRGRLRLEHRGAGGRGVADTWQIEVVVR